VARERYDVRDKVVLVTGASRGIGADAARRLGKRGAKLSLVGLEPELLQQVAAEIDSDIEKAVKGAIPVDEAVSHMQSQAESIGTGL